MRKYAKLRNISDLKYLDRSTPAGTFVFVPTICRSGIFLQKRMTTLNVK